MLKHKLAATFHDGYDDLAVESSASCYVSRWQYACPSNVFSSALKAQLFLFEKGIVHKIVLVVLLLKK
jgi:hypothetical protein